MKQRCPSCGAKNGSGEEKCVRCGYVLYESSLRKEAASGV